MILESSFEKLARIITDKYKIKVVFRGKQAKTNGSIIYLPQLQDADEDFIKLLSGFLDHEAAHILFTDFNQGSGTRNKKVFRIANALEDVRIEKLMSDRFIGCEQNLKDVNDYCFDKVRLDYSGLDLFARTVIALQLILMNRKTIDDFKNEVDVFLILNLLKQEIDTHRHCQNTGDIMRLAKRIYKKIEKLVKEKQQDKLGNVEGGTNESEEGEQDDKGQEGDQSMESDSEGEGDEIKGGVEGDDSDDEGDGENGEASEEESGDSQDDDVEAGDGLGSNSNGDDAGEEVEGDELEKNERKKEEANEPGGDDFEDLGGERPKSNDIDKILEDFLNSSDEEQKKLEDYINEEIEKSFSADAHKRHIPFTTEFDVEHKLYESIDAELKEKYIEYKNKVSPVINALKSKLEAILVAKQNRRWIGDQKKGRINNRALPSLIFGTSTRIFKQRFETITNDVAIMLLVDCSGSMLGDKIALARQSAIAFSECLSLLSIPHEICGFTSRYSSYEIRTAFKAAGYPDGFTRIEENLQHFIFKSFDSNPYNAIRMFAYEGNMDGESIMWAAKRLSLRGERRKIMFVFSDGLPTGCIPGGWLSREFLMETLKKIENSGIETVGFGILSDHVKSFYKNHIIIEKIEELPKEVVRQLTRVLK